MHASFSDLTALLSLRDVGDVYEAVYSVRPRSYNFGLTLKLSPADLDAIRIKYREDPSDCLREMLKTRLKLEHKLTWGEVIKALRKPTVGQHKLADQSQKQSSADGEKGLFVLLIYRHACICTCMHVQNVYGKV